MIDRAFWSGRRILLTGHTGFKGAWMSLLLRRLGAEVYGFALPPEDTRGLFVVGRVEEDVRHRIGDIRDLDSVRSAMADAKPDIVIHMAAQALVRPSYVEPVETYATNVMGTVHVLESIRQTPSVQAAVVVTSDKCYENVGLERGCRETDHLGGHDPYSNSKGCAELVTSAYRRSFFHRPGAASIGAGRAGNVIGGGDWSRDRLAPDAIRAFTAREALRIRNPRSVRPWQHVLDPVIAYLVLAQRLVEGGADFAEGWNFGPSAASEVTVEHVVNALARLWGPEAHWEQDGGEQPHEAAFLRLDCSKAAQRLNWSPLLSLDDALRLTVDWHKAFIRGADMRRFTLAQIDSVIGHCASGINDKRRQALV